MFLLKTVRSAKRQHVEGNISSNLLNNYYLFYSEIFEDRALNRILRPKGKAVTQHGKN
jgi:hypothetical protein